MCVRLTFFFFHVDRLFILTLFLTKNKNHTLPTKELNLGYGIGVNGFPASKEMF